MSLVFYHSQSKANSFPLNRCWWLARHIIDHAVDAAHFVDDAVAYLAQQRVWQLGPVRSHEVLRLVQDA